MLIKQMKAHNSTEKGLICLNADIVMHVAPSTTNTPNTEDAEVFIIPKGTFVK